MIVKARGPTRVARHERALPQDYPGLIGDSDIKELARIRTAAMAARIAAQRAHEQQHRAWRRAAAPMPNPDHDRSPEHHGVGYSRLQHQATCRTNGGPA